jgi:uncharacterized protein YcbX
MRVLQLWRYPVKSLQGEQLNSMPLNANGIEGDRQFAIFDAESGLGLTARRVPDLLFAAARLRSDGGVQITLPDGSVADDDGALSAWLGRRVKLRSTAEDVSRRYENVVDFEHEKTSKWEPFNGAHGAFHDAQGANVSLMSLATIGGWERRRFRSNVILDGDDEESLLGSRVALGDCLLNVGMRIARCVMITRPQPGGVERDLDVLRTIHRQRDGCLAVGATVARQGTVTVGDPLQQASRHGGSPRVAVARKC